MEGHTTVRLILSRKGFDSASGGCPSPIFPDGSMFSLPIPDKRSPVRYRDLVWRGRNIGELVERLTKGRQRRDYRAHLDPDLRPELRARAPGWMPVLGQHGSAQGHLRNEDVGDEDLFLFFGLFRPVDIDLRWSGPPVHVIWGWLQVGSVNGVDHVVRPRVGSDWLWVADHPHLAPGADRSNTLYVARDRLSLGTLATTEFAGAGVFDVFEQHRSLTVPGASAPSTWLLPAWFWPRGRRPLSYHPKPTCWTRLKDRVHLKTAARGQEFVLDANEYPEAIEWALSLLRSSPQRNRSEDGRRTTTSY